MGKCVKRMQQVGEIAGNARQALEQKNGRKVELFKYEFSRDRQGL